MTDPQRLRDAAGTTDLQRSLLGALAGEAPGPQARERTLAALGLSVAVSGAAAAAAASMVATTPAVATTATAATATTATAATVGLATWAKWAGALLALSMIGGSAYVIATRATPTPHASSAAPKVAEPTPTEPALSQADVRQGAGATLPTLAPEALPLAGDTKREIAPTQPHAASPVSAPSSGTLMEELSLMDRARQSLANGSYGEAIRAVSTYEARYPHGSFAQEAEFIRVRALYDQHDDGASAAGRAFLTRYPSSPYAPRVRTLVGRGP